MFLTSLYASQWEVQTVAVCYVNHREKNLSADSSWGRKILLTVDIFGNIHCTLQFWEEDKSLLETDKGCRMAVERLGFCFLPEISEQTAWFVWE